MDGRTHAPEWMEGLPSESPDVQAAREARHGRDCYRRLIRNMRLASDGRLAIPEGLTISPRHPGRR